MQTIATYPGTLHEFLEKEIDQQGFELRIGQYVELDPVSKGFFPAIIAESQEPVFTVDPEVLKEVCRMLPPMQFKLRRLPLYYHEEAGVAYALLGSGMNLRRCHLHPIFTASRLRYTKERGESVFGWMPGFTQTPPMPLEVFLAEVEAAFS